MAKPHDDYAHLPKCLDVLPDVSGNAVNGLGETKPCFGSPLFRHLYSEQAFGHLQNAVLDHHRFSAGVQATY